MTAEQQSNDHFKDLKTWWNEMVNLIAVILVIFGLIFAGQYLLKGFHLIQSWIN